MTAALDEMSLQAHEDKTVQIVVGHKRYIKDMKEELERNPTYMQGFKVNMVESEKYLGMIVTSSGVKGMIDRNIEEKRKKSMPISQESRKLIRDPKLIRIGGLKSACVMLQAKLIPTILYGCQAWLYINKGQIEKLEKIFKNAITKSLSLPKSTNYEVLLNEIGYIHIEQWLDYMKLSIFGNIFQEKKAGRLYQVLREELLEEVKGGVVEEVGKLCDKYSLPNVLLFKIRQEDMSCAVREYSKMRICLMTVILPSVLMIIHTLKFVHEHYEFDVMSARAIMCFNTGNLVFKDTCPYQFRTRDQGSKGCLEKACGGLDSYSHVRYECEFYDLKYVDNREPVKDNANFILKLNDEWIRRWRTSLVIPALPL